MRTTLWLCSVALAGAAAQGQFPNYLPGPLGPPLGVLMPGPGPARAGSPVGEPSAFEANALAVRETQEKQFVVHWLSHYTGLAASISEDPIGEASISGRCSSLPITDAVNAPSLYPNYYLGPTVSTTYWQAPWQGSSCELNSNLTFYKLTWVKSPTAQNVQAWFGSSDYFKLWINGVLLGSRTAGGPKPYSVDEYKYPVTLRAGWNLIVVRQTFPQLGPGSDPEDNNKYKAFSLRFVRDATGTPVTNLVATFDPDPSCDDRNRNAAPYTKVLIPSVAHLAGVGGSQWRTDLEIFNGFPWAFEWRFNYYREGNSSGTPDSSKTLTLAPFENRVFADALPGFFGIGGDEKGYAWVAGPYYWWLANWDLLQAKVYNQAATGTFGMALPLWSVSNVTSSGYFFNVRNGAYRTNVGFIPVPNRDAAYRVRLTMFGPDIPTPVTKEWPQDPSDRLHGLAQLNNVFQYMGLGSLVSNRTNIYFQLLQAPQETRFFSYATVNDNGTSDPLFLAPQFTVSAPPLEPQ